MFVYCDEVYYFNIEVKGIVEIIIGKYCNGLIGIVCVVFIVN